MECGLLRGDEQPAMHLFGVDEATNMLRRVGAGPFSF